MNRPHVAIIRAAKWGRGLRLSAGAVSRLAEDGAIVNAAVSQLTEAERVEVSERGWIGIKP